MVLVPAEIGDMANDNVLWATPKGLPNASSVLQELSEQIQIHAIFDRVHSVWIQAKVRNQRRDALAPPIAASHERRRYAGRPPLSSTAEIRSPECSV